MSVTLNVLWPETVSVKFFLFQALTGHLGQGQVPVTQQQRLLLLCRSVKRDNCSSDIVRLMKGLGGVVAGEENMLGPPVSKSSFV